MYIYNVTFVACSKLCARYSRFFHNTPLILLMQRSIMYTKLTDIAKASTHATCLAVSQSNLYT